MSRTDGTLYSCSEFVPATSWPASVVCTCLAFHVAGVTETCACDSRFYALCRCLAMPWPPRSLYPQSTLNMDAQLDAASTSDVDERELLEAANFDLYWDRVITRSHFEAHNDPPNAFSDDAM